MKSDEINNAIDNLCQKFGTAQETLIPEMARMNVTVSRINIAFFLVLLSISALIIWKFYKAYKNTQYHDEQFFYFMASIFAFGFAIFFMWEIYDNAITIAQWNSAPTAKAVEYILNLVRSR